MNKLFLFLFLFLFACSASQEVVKIGVPVTSSGGLAYVSLPSQHALRMAVEDWNVENELQFELLFEDTKGQGKEYVTAFQKLSSQGVAGMVTDMTTAVMTVHPLASQYKVPTIAYVSTGPSATEKGAYTFRTSIMMEQGMRLLADHMREQGVERIALFTRVNEYTVSLEETLAKEFAQRGGEVVHIEQYTDTKDFRTALLKAEQEQPDAYVLLILSPDAVFNFLQQKKELGIVTPVFGNEVTGYTFIQERKDALTDGLTFVFADYDQAKVQSLQEQYVQRVHDDDHFDWVYVATAYDAGRLLFEAINATGTDPDAIATYLREVQHAGYSGVIDFDEHGDVKERGFDLFQYQQGSVVQLT